MGLSRNKLLLIVAGSAAAVYAAPKVFAALNRNGRLTRLFGETAEKIDRAVGWDRLPVWLSAVTLTGLRHVLRRENLHDTVPAGVPEAAPPPPNPRHRHRIRATAPFALSTAPTTREHPRMGSAGTRFGRNVPIGETYPDKENRLLSPNLGLSAWI
jgi:hypothetical protein